MYQNDINDADTGFANERKAAQREKNSPRAPLMLFFFIMIIVYGKSHCCMPCIEWKMHVK